MINADTGFTDPQQRAASFVSFAAHMIEELPAFAHEVANTYPDVVHNACLESFMINLRLFIEFFIREPKGDRAQRDWTAADFLNIWTPGPDESVGRLDGPWWTLASRQVAHLSKDRTPDEITSIDPVGTSEEALRNVAANCVRSSMPSWRTSPRTKVRTRSTSKSRSTRRTD